MALYKIFLPQQWRAFTEEGRTKGAPIDLADGFIHLSTGEQLLETTTTYFSAHQTLWMVRVEFPPDSPHLKWEPSRGGALFPHFYGILETQHVAHAQELHRQEGQPWSFTAAPGPALPLSSVELDPLTALYDAVGWTQYTNSPNTLHNAVKGSTYCAEVRVLGELIGIIRCISDDATIAYVQDIVVHPEFQRLGVGRALLSAAMERFQHCRQLVLLTDDRPEQTAFYEAMGLTRLDKATSATLRTFARMPGLT